MRETQSFYKEDIMLSFFALIPNNNRLRNNRAQCFYGSPDYAKNHVIACRSIRNLVQKGLVITDDAGGEFSQKIQLTAEGAKKAAELSGVSDYTVPYQPIAKNDSEIFTTTYSRYKKAESATSWVDILRRHEHESIYESTGTDFGGKQIHLVCGAMNNVRGLEQLSSIISVRLRMNPFNGDVYAFCGQTRDNVRYIRWDGSGFQITVRRREHGRYIWPGHKLGQIITVSAKDFAFILGGTGHRNGPVHQPESC